MTELESDAKIVLGNALVAARNSHDEIVRGACGTYGGCVVSGAARIPGICVLCALLRVNEVEKCDDVETAAAELLLLETEWVVDMLIGFDGDGNTLIDYPAAHKIGRALWRKYGNSGQE